MRITPFCVLLNSLLLRLHNIIQWRRHEIVRKFTKFLLDWSDRVYHVQCTHTHSCASVLRYQYHFLFNSKLLTLLIKKKKITQTLKNWRARCSTTQLCLLYTAAAHNYASIAQILGTTSSSFWRKDSIRSFFVEQWSGSCLYIGGFVRLLYSSQQQQQQHWMWIHRLIMITSQIK